jgi:hypothetical protein
MRYSQSMLERMERIVEESQYILRYERGNFQSGYCILEQRRVVVLNKFLQAEGRINILLDLIPRLHINPETLSPELRKTYDEVMLKSLEQPKRHSIPG